MDNARTSTSPVRRRRREVSPMRERLEASVFTAVIGACSAGLICLVRGSDFLVLGSICAAAGAVLGFVFGPRIAHLFVSLVG